MNFLFKLFLKLSSLSFYGAISFGTVAISLSALAEFELSAPDVIFILAVCVFLPIALGYISILLSKKMGTANLGDVKVVSLDNEVYYDVCRVMFFVLCLTLNADNHVYFWFFLSMAFLFSYTATAESFNPIVRVFGYRFYTVTLENDIRVKVITKQKIKSPKDIDGKKQYYRLENRIFID